MNEHWALWYARARAKRLERALREERRRRKHVELHLREATERLLWLTEFDPPTNLLKATIRNWLAWAGLV